MDVARDELYSAAVRLLQTAGITNERTYELLNAAIDTVGTDDPNAPAVSEQVVELLDGGAVIGRMVVITDAQGWDAGIDPTSFAAVARDNLTYRVNGTVINNTEINEWWA
jgi:hypothetical protein